MDALTPDQISELLTHIELAPVMKYEGPNRTPSDRLYLANPFVRDAADRADISFEQLHDTLEECRFPRFSIKPTEALRSWAAENGLVCGFDPNEVDDHYFLEINTSGKLLLKYQQIIGSRQLGVITEDHKDKLIDTMAQLLRERERPTQEESPPPSRLRPRG